MMDQSAPSFVKAVVLAASLMLAAPQFAMAQSKPAQSTPPQTEAYESSPASYSLPDDSPAQMLSFLKPQPVSGTLRHAFVVSAGGSALRIRLSNEEGAAPLVIGSVSVALAKAGTSDPTQTPVQVTFGGKSDISIAPGAPMVSDAVPFAIKPLDSVLVSVYTTSGVQAVVFGATGAMLAPGDQTGSVALAGARQIVMRPIVSGLVVEGAKALPVVVTLGDSITDGARMSSAQPAGYPATLMQRLAVQPAGRRRAVVNAGIAGNRLVSAGWGPSALARLDRDVLRIPNVSHLIVLEGINDIGLGGLPLSRKEPSATADQIIAAYHQIITRAHARGIKVIGGTLLPFKGAPYYTPEKDTKRLAVNTWIRTSGAFDAVIDFEAITKDPSDASRLNPAYDSGDHLHPNDKGYSAMGNAIDLGLFR